MAISFKTIAHDTSIFLILFNSLFTIPCTIASTKSTEAPHTESENIPAGFEDLASAFASSVSVYYQGKNIGDFEANYGDGMLTFVHPKNLLVQLKFVKDKNKLLNALKQPLQTHQDLICVNNKLIPICNKPATKTVSIIFNPDWFRADLFINHDLLDTNKYRQYLIDQPRTFLSWLNNVRFVKSGNNRNSDITIYTLNNTGAVGLGVSSINYDLVTRHAKIARNETAVTHQFQTLDMTYYYDRYQLQLGYLRSNPGYFINTKYFFGVSTTTNRHLLDYDYMTKFSHKLEIFLDEPSQVSIINEDKVISTGNYSAGLQSLDTAALRPGSYDLIIRVTNYLGKTIDIKRFFTKTTTIPPPEFPEYFFSIGQLAKRGPADQIMPTIINQPIFNIGTDRRINDYFGCRTSLLKIADFTYIDSNIYGTYKGWQVQPSMLIGLDRDFGFALGASYKPSEHLDISLLLRSMWAKKNPPATSDPSYDQFITNSKSLAVGSGLKYGKHNYALSIIVTRSANDSYSMGYGYQLYHGANVDISLNTDLNITNNNHAILAGFQVSFHRDKWNVNNTEKYTSTTNTDTNKKDSSFNSSLSVTRSFEGERSTGEIGIALTNEQTNTNSSDFMSLNESYRNELGTSRSNITYSSETEGFFYNMELTSAFAVGFSPAFNASIGSMPRSIPAFAGVLIHTSGSPGDEGEFEVYNYNAKIGSPAKIGTTKLYPLPPFQKYSISIQSISEQAYSYHQTPYTDTYFPANISSYSWKIQQLITYAITLKLPNGEAIEGASYTYDDSIYESDEDGYIMLELPAKKQQITLMKDSRPYCQINLETPTSKKNRPIIELGDVTCLLIH